MDIEQLKEVELEILKRFADICFENNLKYSLHFGTLLGCVRHKGFIPWDDDIDVMMPIEDYKKFTLIAQEQLGEDFFFQNNKTDNLNRSFSKIRKNNTCVITSLTHKQKCENQGIFIDIFPIGYLPRNKFIQFIQKMILELVGQMNTTYCIEIVNANNNFADKFIKLILLLSNKIIPHKLRSWLYEKITSIGTDENSDYLCGFYAEKRGFIQYCRFRKDLFQDLIQAKFEQYSFYIPYNYDEVLTQLYGDYMKIPPKEQRITHGFLDYDLKRNYNKYILDKVDWQPFFGQIYSEQ